MTVDGGRATIRKLFILDLFFLNTDDPLMHNVLTSPVSLGTATEGAHRPERHKSPGQSSAADLTPRANGGRLFDAHNAVPSK